VTLLAELKDALTRAHLKDRYHLTLTDIRDFVALLTTAGIVVSNPRKMSILLRDPDDLPVLACALTGEADYIVTGDNDLLELKSFEGIEILRPTQFLHRLH
jgi:putative PIN family toxin of toxin-antitoxin system